MFEHLNIIKKESMSTSSIIFHVWTYFMFEHLNIIKKESMSTSSIIFHVWTPEHNKERKHVLRHQLYFMFEHLNIRKRKKACLRHQLYFMFEYLNIIKKESMSTSSIIFHVWIPEHNKERKHVYVINYISCLNTWT